MTKHLNPARPATVTVQPYDARLHYATTPEAWAKIARRFGQDPTAPDSVGRTDQTWDSVTGRTHLVVWVDLARHATGLDVLATIAHEAYHASVGLLEAISAQVTAESEPTAYLVDWTVRWLAEHTPGLDVTWTRVTTPAAP